MNPSQTPDCPEIPAIRIDYSMIKKKIKYIALGKG